MGVRFSPLAFIALLAAWISAAAAQTDPLPSWNDGPTKQAIVAFVTDVTREGSPDYVPGPERVATFDNDGTLWIEQPLYVQFAFALDRVKAMAPLHPEWKDKQPFKAVLDGDMGGRCRRRAWSGRDRRCHARRHDTGRVPANREGVARDRQAPPLQPPLRRTRLPADAGSPGVHAGERVQDLHRVGRRHRVHPSLRGGALRHSARAGRGLKHRHEVRAARRQADPVPPAASEFHRRRSRQARRHQPADRPPSRSRRLGTPMAISRCCNGRPWRADAAWASWSITPMRSASTPTTGSRRSDTSTRPSKLRRWTGGLWST